MFGHHDDVISQDQKTDASVPLEDTAIDALMNAPATSSVTDSPMPTASAPALDNSSLFQQPVQPAQPTPVGPSPHSFDGLLKPADHLLPDHTTPPQSHQYAGSSNAPAYASQAQTHQSYRPVEPQPEMLPEDPGQYFQPAPQTSRPQSDSTPKPKTQPPSGDLLKIKEEALHSLQPLVGKLDLKPEEKFRTLMMLIQASDDHSLLNTAYQVARSIEDEKVRAQALLDVINEINYFTQNQKTA